MYEIIWVGSDLSGLYKDGEQVATFNDLNNAIRFAHKFSDDHEADFDPLCGGVMIRNADIEGDAGIVMDW